MLFRIAPTSSDERVRSAAPTVIRNADALETRPETAADPRIVGRTRRLPAFLPARSFSASSTSRPPAPARPRSPTDRTRSKDTAVAAILRASPPRSAPASLRDSTWRIAARPARSKRRMQFEHASDHLLPPLRRSARAEPGAHSLAPRTGSAPRPASGIPPRAWPRTDPPPRRLSRISRRPDEESRQAVRPVEPWISTPDLKHAGRRSNRLLFSDDVLANPGQQVDSRIQSLIGRDRIRHLARDPPDPTSRMPATSSSL